MSEKEQLLAATCAELDRLFGKSGERNARWIQDKASDLT